MSFLSYGEKIEVIVSREKGGGSKVYVFSKPKMWFNITAGEATKKNVQRVFELIDEQVE